jgi:hypothetical protein
LNHAAEPSPPGRPPTDRAAAHALRRLVPALALLALAGCAQPTVRYSLVEDSLRARDPVRADLVLEQAKEEYRAQDRLLYLMDRGMTLHLAGRYEDSNRLLQEADEMIDALYTRRVRTEAKAFLLNDTELPYEGDPYEQVMVNVLKALNYALLDRLDEALVEARLVDRRLNGLADGAAPKQAYREDPFARYLTGILYESARDLNNAFIAYRKAYEGYRAARSWLKVPVPSSLQADLLRLTEALHLETEHRAYREEFPNTAWLPVADTASLAELVVISYNGRAPRKEDQFLDLPVSFEALRLVLMTKGALSAGGASGQDRRAIESALYGVNGQIVRVALPEIVPQPSGIAYEEVSLRGERGEHWGRSEVVHDVTAVAQRTLADRFSTIALKAVARAAVKYALAEGAGYGARSATGGNAGPIVGLLVHMIAHAMAVASEEADKRSWRTLPAEVQVSRLRVPPGTYRLSVQPVGRRWTLHEAAAVRTVTLTEGRTTFVITRHVS